MITKFPSLDLERFRKKKGSMQDTLISPEGRNGIDFMGKLGTGGKEDSRGHMGLRYGGGRECRERYLQLDG